LRFALDAAGIGTWHLDLQTGVATFDESLNTIFGLEPVETRAPLDERLASLHPDDRDRIHTAMDAAIAARQQFSLEFRIVRPDGSIRWLRDRGRIIADEDGQATAATGAVVDITDRRRLEEHDRLSSEVLQVLAATGAAEDALSAVVEVLAPRFAASCAVYLKGDDALTIAATAGTPYDPDDQALANVVRGGRLIHVRDELLIPLRAGGATIGVLALAASDRTFDSTDVTFATELADRVALAIDHMRLFRDLERANRVKDDFLATLSHELRTPLNAVLGWTRMLRQGAVAPERTPAILETIERNATAQMQLVEELLDLSAMVAGGLRLTVTRVDLRDVVGGAIETVRPAADAKSLRINLAIDDSVSELAGDPARLRQVLWNLLANAVTFTPAGGTVDVRVTDGPSDVEITVSDTGPGIASDFLPHVFEPFRQAETSVSRVPGGLGLGLSIVRHIVEAHGGTCAVHSRGPGVGTKFSVRLPSGRSGYVTDSAYVPGGLRGRRVLAVDDDESTRDLVATMLVMYGVSVRTAARTNQALQIVSEWNPDVLLADIAMPGEDGYALIRHVRALPPPIGAIPAVALTGFTDPQSVQRAFASGFDAHLGKPLEPHVLADALIKVLRKRRN
jgi:PAS domain S-box-containing protein